jgi:AraC-like DNA-binding protein
VLGRPYSCGMASGSDLALKKLMDRVSPPWEAFDYYQRLERLKRYVEINYQDDLSLTRAAAIVAMEPSAFSRFFRRAVGITFTQWLARVRLVKAMEAFSQKNLAVTEVALDVGFADVRTFQRAFKKFTGLTPFDFKRLVRTGCVSAGAGQGRCTALKPRQD